MSHTLTKFAGIHTNWVSEKNAVGTAGDPPWDLLMRAFVNYTGNFRMFPQPRLEHTQWETVSYEGERIVLDGEEDTLDYTETHVYFYDHSRDLMAEYVFSENGRMRSRVVKQPKLPSYRQKKVVPPSPELGKALKTLLK